MEAQNLPNPHKNEPLTNGQVASGKPPSRSPPSGNAKPRKKDRARYAAPPRLSF